MLVLERYIPPFPLQMERMGPQFRVTSLSQISDANVVAVIGPQGPKGDDGIIQSPPDILDYIANFEGSLT